MHTYITNLPFVRYLSKDILETLNSKPPGNPLVTYWTFSKMVNCEILEQISTCTKILQRYLLHYIFQQTSFSCWPLTNQHLTLKCYKIPFIFYRSLDQWDHTVRIFWNTLIYHSTCFCKIFLAFYLTPLEEKHLIKSTFVRYWLIVLQCVKKLSSYNAFLIIRSSSYMLLVLFRSDRIGNIEKRSFIQVRYCFMILWYPIEI